MAAIAIHIHPASNIKWAPFRELGGDGVRVQQAEPQSGTPPGEPMALRFTDPDGEMHIYPFTEQGKQALLQQLTGGVIVP